MTVDIKNLSSKELFELAKQKEQEEREATQRTQRLAEAKRQRASLVAKHEEALAAADKAISELQQKRSRMVAEFEAALAPVDLDIRELERKVKADQLKAESPAPRAPVASPLAPRAPSPSPAAPKVPAPQLYKPAPATQDTDKSDELLIHIRNIMRNRTYISESLLKEKLKGNGFDTTNLKKEMEKLIHEGKLEKKGSGNFALGKRK
jgi:hypothetical protein